MTIVSAQCDSELCQEVHEEQLADLRAKLATVERERDVLIGQAKMRHATEAEMQNLKRHSEALAVEVEALLESDPDACDFVLSGGRQHQFEDGACDHCGANELFVARIANVRHRLAAYRAEHPEGER